MVSNRIKTTDIDLLSPTARLRLVPKLKPSVLIVEDYDDSRDMLRVLLEMKDWRVSEARDGLAAVEMALRLKPDVILMDGSLPYIDGLEATRRIRRNELSGRACILALNGWGTNGYHDAAIAAGCDECLVKPIDFDLLEMLIAPFLRQTPLAIKFRGARA
jgi:two-component system, cell cycle response regulator DivK